MKRLLVALIFVVPQLLFAQAPGCPNIQVDDETVSCNTPCVDLVATFLQTGQTTSYGVSSIPYAPPYPFTGGTGAFIGTDDIFSVVINLPFDFCFYGNTYNQLVIGANGLISFDVSLANAFCTYSFTSPIPSSPTLTGPYQNSINGAYLDIDPAVGGDINYATLGTAPCRTFVVNFNNVPSFGCNNLLVTQQIVIYETTNAIEVYIEDKPTCITWNSGNAVIGIQNIGATQGICPPNRNTGPWTATNEAWRFTPNGTPNYAVEWFDISGSSLGFGDTLNICTQTQDNFTAEISYTNCNGAVVPESVTNTVFINSAAGQIANLGLVDTIKSCTTPVTINADNTMDTYLWNTGENTSSITVNQTGNYVLEATQGGCDGDDTVYVSIVNANIVEEDLTICNFESVDLNIEQTNTIVNWSTLETTDNITVYPSNITEYWVEISDGITLCKDSIQINVDPVPTVFIDGINKICIGDSTSLQFLFSGNQPFNINLNNQSYTFTNFNELLNISPLITTDYLISYIEDVNCNDNISSSHTVNVNPLPKPVINPDFYELYPGEDITLTAGSYAYYWWYTDNSFLISESEFLLVDSTLTTYIVVESNDGCIGTSETAIVQYIRRVELFIPNTFTPNGDEHNELFVIKGRFITSFDMIITDRWGEMVYKTDKIDKYWDGKYLGVMAQQGVYSYVVDIIGDDARPFSTSGTVNVIY
ncbi:MAG: gliding motility-associated C-terminal domain-containing protein [Cryomorphaceae bacterium]|nr:gliding motility-associated C-terminal domain-containing protein [Cryomorphaceae bacterium]